MSEAGAGEKPMHSANNADSERGMPLAGTAPGGLQWPLFIVLALLATGVLIYLLRPVLSPFLVGILLAYLGDPTADRIESMGLSRTVAVIVVFLGMTALLGVFLLFFVPMLGNQLDVLREVVPSWIEWLQVQVLPAVQSLLGMPQDAALLEQLKLAVSEHWNQAGSIASELLPKIGRSSVALIAALGNLALIPVVTFYLLRDWDVLMGHVEALVPRARVDVIKTLANECDKVLSAFLRGQLLIMICLGGIYAVGLTIVGLDLALLLGMIAGLASVVPYLGFIVGIIAAGVAAMVQFHDVMYLLAVLGVFGVGQLLESLFLTPVLVGDRVGLHPVAVIFAILAGGQLFGFVGVLLGLPFAAIAMVLLRHLHHNYTQSVFYAKHS